MRERERVMQRLEAVGLPGVGWMAPRVTRKRLSGSASIASAVLPQYPYAIVGIDRPTR